jgi:hypothetical protein
MYNCPKKMSNTSGSTMTGDIPGAKTFLQSRNNQELSSAKCADYLDTVQNSLPATNISYIYIYINKRILKPIWAYRI